MMTTLPLYFVKYFGDIYLKKEIFHVLQFSSKRLSELVQAKDANIEKQILNAKRLCCQTRKHTKKPQLHWILQKLNLKITPRIS